MKRFYYVVWFYLVCTAVQACPLHWQIYRSSKFHFSLCYPSSVTLVQQPEAFQTTYLLDKNRHALVEFQLPALQVKQSIKLQPYHFMSVVRVSISSDSLSMQQCHNQTISNVAMGHFIRGYSYRYHRAGQCLVVEWITTGDLSGSGGRAPLSSKVIAQRQQSMQLVKKIALTFVNRP
jgi:hypothetical protein